VHSGRPTDLEEAFELDPDQLPDRAATVASEEVASLDLVGALVREVGDHGDDAVIDLLERGDLVMEADAARCEFLGPRLHQWFEADLGQVGSELGAGRYPVGVVSTSAPGFLCKQDAASIGVTREAGIEGGAAQLLGWSARRVDGVGDTAVVEDLHGPLAEDVGLGQQRRVGKGAHELVVDAHLREEHRRRESRPTASDDEHVRCQPLLILLP
jgi:hypothetical protein